MDGRPELSFHRVSLDILFFTTIYLSILSNINAYSVASTENAAFIIGGRVDYSTSSIDIIAKFEDNQWTRYGSLKAARYVHGSITSADQTMIIGGESASLVQISEIIIGFTTFFLKRCSN